MATAQAQQRLAGATQVGRYFVRPVSSKSGSGGYDVLDVNGYAITWRETGASAYARAEELTVLDAEREQRAAQAAKREQQQQQSSTVSQSEAWRYWMNGAEW